MKYIVIIIGNLAEWVLIYYYLFSVLEKRFSQKKTIALYVFLQTINLTRSVLLMNNLPLKSLTGVPYGIFVTCVVTKGTFRKKMLVYACYTLSTLLAEITGTVIAKIYGYHTAEYLEVSWECFLWQGTVFFFILVYSTITLLFLKRKKIADNVENTKFISLYILLQSFIVFLFMVLAVKYGEKSLAAFLTLFFVLIMSMVVAVLIYKEMKTVAQKNAEAEFIRKQTEIKDKHFLEIKAQFIDYRRLRHDFYNHIKIIDSLNDPESLKEYVGSVTEKFRKMDQTSYCNNLTLDALLSLKCLEAKQKGININIEVGNIDDMEITDFDLCSVISNLLDNGIEAAEKTPKKSINLEVNKKTDRLIIVMKNSSQEVSSCMNTTKTDKNNHGLGISAIKSIAEKYDGDAVFKYNENEFISIVTMKYLM